MMAVSSLFKPQSSKFWKALYLVFNRIICGNIVDFGVLSMKQNTSSLPSPRLVKFVLVTSMILMGACGLAYEYVLSILGNYLLGTSYEEIFIIIGIMMFAMGIGSLFQRVLVGNLFEKFLILEIFLGLTGGFSSSIVYAAFAVTPAYRVLLYIFALMIGGMIGLEIPLLIRINQDYSDTLRVNLSEILFMDYIGSLIGALLFTYVLLVSFSLAQISFLLGLTNVLIGLISLLIFKPFINHFTHYFVVAISIIILLIWGSMKAEDWTRWSEQKYYNDPVIYTETTPFQHITLTKGKKELNLFINGNLQFSSSDEFIYHELLVIPSLLMNDNIDEILILGGGDGLALREVLKFPSVRKVDLVDLDPAMIKLASNQPDLVALNKASFYDSRVAAKGKPEAVMMGEKENVYTRNWRPEFVLDKKRFKEAKVSVYLIDADLFIRNFNKVYDRIIIDLPDPSRLELAKLYSKDFYAALKKHLSPDGFITVQSTSPFYSKNAFHCIGESLREAGYKILPYHENVPSFGEWGWHLAWRHNITIAQIMNRLRKIKTIPVATKYLTLPMLLTRFIFPKNMPAFSRTIQANTKMNPVLWTFYRKDWAASTN